MVAAKILTNEASALDRLFTREYGRIVAIAARILAHRTDAEDVAQEVFAQCVRSGRAELDGAAAWLATAAVRRALNLLRTRRRRVAREVREYRLAAAAREARERAADPTSILDREDSRSLVRAAMLQLAERDAAILALRYGGSSYREIAAALAIDAAQIGTRLVRAERALRKEVERALR